MDNLFFLKRYLADRTISGGAIIREGITLPPQTIVNSGQMIMGWPLKENHKKWGKH